MDKKFNQMQDFAKHTATLPRNYAMLPQVASIGHLPHKTVRMEKTFDSCNFSFILAGEGEYIFRGRPLEVKAPCLLTQWPGEPMNYGGVPEWYEIYLIYEPGSYQRFADSGLLTPEHPVRPIYNIGAVIEKWERLKTLIESEQEYGDEIDLACYSMILKGLSQDAPERNDPVIATIKKYLAEVPGREINNHALARMLGMSVSTLRRYWLRHEGPTTFAGHRRQLFLHESCRLLIETNLQIKEIAISLGIDDQYYFSRKFHQSAGMTPTAYRKKFGICK